MNTNIIYLNKGSSKNSLTKNADKLMAALVTTLEELKSANDEKTVTVPDPRKPVVYGGRIRAQNGANDRFCAIIGCEHNSVSKGYCPTHYQKLRMLAKQSRLPQQWMEYAPANSVANVKFPRGRPVGRPVAMKRRA